MRLGLILPGLAQQSWPGLKPGRKIKLLHPVSAGIDGTDDKLLNIYAYYDFRNKLDEVI